MYSFRLDPGALGVGVAFTAAKDHDGQMLSLGGAHGSRGRPAGVATVEDDLGVRLALVRQVHGRAVVEANTSNLEDLADAEADGLVTTTPGIGLAIRVADCVPVLLADGDAQVIGAAHAGRVGLTVGVLEATVEAMRDRGAERIRAWIGPHICGQCYEVPEAMADEVAARVPAVRTTTRWGSPGLDLGAGAAAILELSGVAVSRVPGCTLEQEDLHSYRRSAAASGRQAGIIWLPTRLP